MQNKWIYSHVFGMGRIAAALWLALGGLMGAYFAYVEDVARATRNSQPVVSRGSVGDDVVSWASALVPAVAVALALAVFHSRASFGASTIGASITMAFGGRIVLNEPTQVGLGSGPDRTRGGCSLDAGAHPRGLTPGRDVTDSRSWERSRIGPYVDPMS